MADKPKPTSTKTSLPVLTDEQKLEIIRHQHRPEKNENELDDDDPGPPLSPVVQPLAWLLGRWRSVEAQAIYPTMEPFSYIEELEFFHTGQPNIQFNFNSCDPDTKKPMHRETGFIRIDPSSNKVALIIAMNIGVCEIEEGTLEGRTMVTESKTIGSISFGKLPRTKKVSRTIRLEGEVLEQLVAMETSKTEHQQHLTAKYKKL